MTFTKKLIKLNKRGSGIVTVIIAIALVSMLVSVMLTTSYLNYKMKVTDARAKDTFYSAEVILDEISVGLQGIVSDALSSAYLEVFVSYNNLTIDEKNSTFESKYYTKIYEQLAADFAYSTFDMNLIKSFISASPWDASTKTGYRITSASNTMVTYSNLGIVLEDIEVYYRDASGRSSTITTDIRLCKPTLDFGAATATPNINKYVVIGDSGVNVKVEGGATTELTGNVYGSVINAETTSSGTIKFTSDDVIVSKSDINITKANVEFPSLDANIWAEDMVVNSAHVEVASALNLSDDINIKGNGSQFYLTNRLNAFGTSMTDSSKSSAILVNGTNAVLDFTNAELVTIAGHAFINTQKVNYGSVGGTNVGNGSNVYTGESISVKSNQLMYLIPGECIGVGKSAVTNEAGEIVSYTYGTSKFNQNPISASQYASINNDRFEMVLETREVDVLGGKPLSTYIAHNNVGGVLVPKYETVFVQTNGETMVYFYMTFASEKLANKYFTDYYNNNADSINQYLDYYLDKLVIPDARNMVRLNVAGNYLTMNDTGTVTKNNYTVENASDKLGSSETIYAREKDSLCTKLIANYSDLGAVTNPDLSGNVIFENLIDMDYWQTAILDRYGAMAKVKFYDDAYDYVVVLTAESDYIYDGSDNYSGRPVRLIVSSGNVHVNADFSGLILAKGTVTVASGKKLEARPDEVALTFWYQNLNETDEAKRFNVYSIFRDGSRVARDTYGLAKSDTSLSLSNLVVYENWSKR